MKMTAHAAHHALFRPVRLVLDQNTFLPRLDELVDLSDGDSDEDDDESVRTCEHTLALSSRPSLS
jgi:hypothetical protein